MASFCRNWRFVGPSLTISPLAPAKAKGQKMSMVEFLGVDSE
jgi:hypothetical protein